MKAGIVGGIEGGATHSSVVLLNSDGDIVSKLKGPGTNHHLTGMEECRRRIAEMINEAKKIAAIGETVPLEALGLSLSGCESEVTNQELIQGLISGYPNLSKHYTIGSDTDGAIATTSNRGGVVCIAGTGSNTLLVNPDGTRAQCGGWGYLLGDEGSAWSVAQKAVKTCFNHLDGFQTSPYPIDTLWDYIKSYFNAQSQPDLLSHFYKDFNKAHIAHVCKGVAEIANKGDRLSQHIFEEAGQELAQSIAAVYQKASPELTNREGGLHVLCVGSVWLSWQLLKKGFIGYLDTKPNIKKLSLLRVKIEAGVGAAYIAADSANFEVQRDYSSNYSVFHVYNKDS